MNLLNQLADAARKKAQQAYNTASGNRQQVATNPIQVRQQIQNAKYGVLANNPAKQQQFIRSVAPPRPQNPLQNIGGGFVHGLPTLGMAAGRTVLDVGQGVSGLVDLASKGTGTNRVSDFLDTRAKQLDQMARNRNVQGSYEAAQIPLNISAFAVPGLATSKLGKVGAVTKLAKPVTSLNAKAGKAIDAMKFSDDVIGRTAHAITKNVATPQSLMNTAYGTLSDLGRESGKGNDVSPISAAITGAANLGMAGALPGVAHLAGEGARAVVPTTKLVGQKLASPEVLNIKPFPRVRPEEHVASTKLQAVREGYHDGMDVTPEDVQLANKFYKKAGIDPRDANAIALANKRMTDYQNTNIRRVGSVNDAVKSVKKQLPTDQKGFVKIPGGSKDPAPDLTPEQKTFINEYANMLESEGGNAPTIKGDGSRVSNNGPNYAKLYAEKGRTPTKQELFDEARKQIETGKAGYGASDEYKQIGVPRLPKDHPHYWATPIEGEPKGKMPNVKDTNGIQPKEGDVIEFGGLLGKEGRSTIRWNESHIANASGKRVEGSWTGNGVLREDSRMPFTIVERDGKPFTATKPVAKQPATPAKKPQVPAKSQKSSVSSAKSIPSAPTIPTKKEAVKKVLPSAVEEGAKSTVDAGAGDNTPPNTSKLNTNRLNTSDANKAQLDKDTTAVIGKLSNKDVETAAKGAGIDTKTHTIDQTKKIIAEQLNVRKDAVRLSNEAEAARKAGDIDKAADLIKQAAEQGRTSRSQGTDIARQLQARKIIANELDTPQHRIFKLLDEAGINPEVYSKRLAEVDFTNSKQVVDAYRELVPAKFGNWLDTLRYNSMLSSPLTQAVNVFGNAQNVLVAGVEKNLRGNIDAIGGLFGKKREYARGEGTAYVGASAKALGEASHNFVDALRGTGKYANKDLEEYSMPLATKGVAGAAYKTLSFPMRVLDGFDKFFRTMAEAGEDASLTHRENKGIAVKGNREALKKSEADYRVFQTDLGTPGQGILNQSFDEFAKSVMKLRNSKIPPVALVAKFTVPFVKTVNNINKQGIVDYSPLGAFNLKGNADKTTAITRAIMGSVVFGTSAALIGAGQMTWAEPRDAEGRARFRSEGKQPYAVKIGDRWVNFSKLTPSVAFPMAMTAALHDAMENGKTDQSTVDKVIDAVAKYANFMTDQSYAKSIGDTLGAIGGDKEAVASAGSNAIQQVVPFRALTGWVARISDNTERKVDTTKGYIDQQVQALMQQYPGLRQKTNTRDYKGTPIAANNQVINGFSPVKVTNDRGVNPVDKELDLAKQLEDTTKGLSASEKAELSRSTDGQVREAQQKLIKTPEYQALTPEDKARELRLVDSRITRQNGAAYKANKGIPTTGSTSSKTDDYYKSPDAEYKALKASYETKLKDGSYNSPTQRIKAENELQKAKAGSAYSKDIRDLYSLNKSDVYQYLTTDKDGKAIADKLVSYGDALVSAGITAKNTFRDKYGNISLAPAQKSTGGGGRKSSLKATNNISGRIALSRKVGSTKINSKKISLSAKLKTSTMKAQKAPTLYRKKIA